MTASIKSKRLNAVEVALTPKEWAIKLADQMRSHPSEMDFMQAIARGTYRDSPIIKPFLALADQAEKRHPGNKPGAIHARSNLNRALRMEYHGLKGLIFSVNEAVKTKGEVAGLKAALKLARLEKMVLQDAFGRTANKAVEWVQTYKTADVKDWIAAVVALASHVFAHRAAIRVVQDKHFDGHPILFRDVETGLDDTIKTLEDGIATFNDYLKARAASTIPGEREGPLAIDIDAIHAAAKKILAGEIANEWIQAAKDKARADILEETDEHGAFVWDRFRQQVGVKP
jgi:hypothetical protein